MTSKPAPRGGAAGRDLAGIAVLWSATFVMALTLDVSESLAELIRREDGLKVGGMFLAFLVLALSLGLFAARRWREAGEEAVARRRSEEELKRALDIIKERLREGVDRENSSNQMLRDETTQRIQAQNALRASLERFRDFLENANDLVQSVAPDGRLLYVNRAWKRALGYDDADVARLSLADVIAPEHRGLCEVALRRVTAGESLDRFETVFVAKDGRKIIVEGSVNGRFEGAELRSCRGIFRDVTERRAAERRLAAQHAVARVLGGNSALREAVPGLLGATVKALGWDAGLFWTARDPGDVYRCVGFWGDPALKATALEEASCAREVSLGEDVPGQVGAFGAPCWIKDVGVEPGFRRAAAAAAAGLHAELAFPVLVEGRAIAVVELLGREVRGPDIATLGAVVSIATQISQFATRERAEERLREAKEAAEAANRAKSQFLAHMSHELRTPLNSVIGFAGILVKNKGRNLRSQDVTYVEKIRDNGMHLLGLINGVLDLAKIESGKETLEAGPVALGDLVRDTLSQLEGQVVGREIALAADVPPSLEPLATDAGKLRQVIVNLVGNALKFTERGRVTVRVHADPATGRAVRIEVADTGIGIPPDRREAIFEAFQQADTTTARRYGGTGLGLTICRSLCDMMGYRITLESEVGKGSTFSVHLGRDKEGSPGKGGAREVAA